MKKEFNDFQKLQVWQKAHKLCLDFYQLSKTFPKEETYGLTSQMRRSVVSVTSNIAEGYGRFTPRSKAYFYRIAYSSLSEFISQTILVKDLGYISGQDNEITYGQSNECQKMLYVMIARLIQKGN